MAARDPDELDDTSLVPDLSGVPEDDGVEADDSGVPHTAGAALDREEDAP